MSRDKQLIVNLEVTVPRILLPLLSLDGSDVSEEAEQVRLSPTGPQDPSADLSRQQGEAATSVTYYATQQAPFRLFSIKGIQARGQTLLLQVCRSFKRSNREQQQQDVIRVTDELAFTVEIRSIKDPSEATGRTPLPGLNQVVIFRDEEDIPNSYSIDGAER